MRITVNKSLLAIAVSSVLAAPAVNATNGYFSHGYSTKEKGLAGAGTAYSQDAMASATNPAGMAFVGERMDIGVSLFSPSRSYTVTGTPDYSGCTTGGSCTSIITNTPGATEESDSNFFLIPHFAYNKALNSESAVGVAVYGNGGMNTNYPLSATNTNPSPNPSGTFGAGSAGVNLEQLFINTSYAYKFDPKNAVGASLVIAAQRFAAKGVDAFAGFSSDPGNLSGNRHSVSYGAGIKLGYQGEVSEGVRLGASYQSKMSMGEFDEYKGLFAESGGFDIPSTYNIGISVDVGPSGMIVADIQRINYTDVKAISNPIANLFTCTGPTSTTCLGASNGGGFGWEDMTIYKIGYQFNSGDNTYRFGYSFTDQPIPDSETLFNVLAPAVVEQHFTAGMTMKMPNNQELNLAGMYAPSNSVKGPNPFDGGQTQIEIEMSQWELQAGWAWKY